jgi:hypothetical protein
MLVDIKVLEREREIDWRQSSRKETNFGKLHTPLYRCKRGRGSCNECGRMVGRGNGDDIGNDVVWMGLQRYTKRTDWYNQWWDIARCPWVTRPTRLILSAFRSIWLQTVTVRTNLPSFFSRYYVMLFEGPRSSCYIVLHISKSNNKSKNGSLP